MKEENKNKIYKIIDYTWVIVAIFIFIATIKLLNEGTLGEHVALLGIWAPLVIVLLKVSTLVFAPLGGMPLYIIAGALFGTWQGFLLCLLGDILGSAICFILSRRYGFKVVRFFAGGQNISKINKALELLNSTSSFIKARIAFAGIPELLAYAAGLSRIGFWKFLALHIPLYIPIDFILVFLGASVAQFTTNYAVFISLVIFGVAGFGIWLLSKDYRKVEGM